MPAAAGIPVAAGAVALAALLWAEWTGRPLVRGVAKLAASAGFVALALVVGVETATARILLAGLLLAAVGDACLLSAAERPFLAGLGAFFLCHVAYAVAFARVSAPSPSAAALLAAAAVAIVRWLWPHLGPMRPPVVAYAAALSAMLWLALGTGRPAVAAGAALFYVSDLVLARDRFVRPARWHHLAIYPAYFVGQYLIAASIG